MLKKEFLAILVVLSFFLIPNSIDFTEQQISTPNDNLEPKALSLTELWSFTTGGAIYTSPVFIDQDRDLDLEIVFGSSDDYIYCVNNTGDEVWKYQTGDDVVASPAIADLDNDSSMDILAISKDGYMYCLNISGGLKWKTWLDTPVAYDPIVVDLDLDGDYEILTSNSTNRLYVIDHQGHSLWNASHANYVGDPPVICDYTGDSKLEVIVPGLGGPIYYDNEGTLLYVEEGRADILISNQEMVVADINVSGTNQLLFYENTDTLVCSSVTYDGGYIHEYWKKIDMAKGTPLSSPVIADVNGDTIPEILIQTSKPGMSVFGNQGILYCIQGNGEELWTNVGIMYGSSQPVVADLNNNGTIEIIVGNTHGYLTVLDSVGNKILDYSSGAVTNSPLVIDINNDGILEIIYPCSNGNLYCLEVTSATKSGETLWSRKRCSTFNTGQRDTDGDHLDDLTEETFFGSNIDNNDSDADDLEDWIEVYSYNTNPTDEDTDGDNVTDWDELYFETNPLEPDSDFDGLTDRFELDYGTDPWDTDTDDDLLTDGEEWNGYGSNPLLADTDGDGLDDWEEVNLGSDGYITGITYADTDSDGIDDGDEVNIYDTNPTDADSDDDTILDGEEIIDGTDGYTTDPLDADTDGDNFDDNDEIAAGTDPTDPTDYPTTPTPTPTNTTTPTSEGSLIGGMIGLLAVCSTVLFILVTVEKRRKYLR